MHTPARQLNHRSPPDAKIARFRSLFRGRSDVYPRRFESKRTGKSGYAPACGNEWIRGVCEKPCIKCSDCPCQNWLPVSEEVIRWHLEGKDASGEPFVIGVYPMLLDETCFFLAVDFDGEKWRTDTKVFIETCRARELPVAIERSRSGNGAHAWFFFQEAIPAALARRLGTHLLTETLEKRPGIGLDSYDRFFPNQDTLPRGGFGNLIALPLQRQARTLGNSVFLDENLEPFGDQWAALGGFERIPQERVDMLVSEAGRNNRVLPIRMVPEDEFALSPWKAPPSRRISNPPIAGTLPKSIEVVLADQLYIPKDALPPGLKNRLIQIAAFQNPEFHRAQAMRLPTYDKPRIIACAEEHAAHIALPRGCREDVEALFKTLRIRTIIKDERQRGAKLPLTFHGELHPGQIAAGEAMLAHDFGVLAATTAFGKTVVASWLIAKRGVNTLVLVHRQQLMEQWVDRLSHFLGVPMQSIGRLGGGRRKLTSAVDVALLQSMVRKGEVDDRIADYGQIIVDECHHIPAGSFELVARRAKSRFVAGLSATVARKDGRHPVIFMQCGPVRHRVDAKKQAEDRPFSHRVLVRPTGHRPQEVPSGDARRDFQTLCDGIMRDEARNALICGDVAGVLAEGRCPLVLTERTEHLDLLAARLASLRTETVKLRGGLGKKALLQALERIKAIPESDPRIVLATGRFVGEGFDDPRLDTLFLAMPVSWKGTIAQYVGRLHRLHASKREVRVYDYADLDAPMLAKMFERRCAGYESSGYTILLPGSALPGWPTEVPLPVDPGWKRDYSGSIQRLIRDGVDIPLARLFVQASVPREASGQPRSATEAFFFQRLETLAETRGRFQLNAKLPIPFDEQGTMEVDFYCEEAKLAIELDGPQHLGNEQAWRRDRKKDFLLQRNGILILRFLATDIGKHLGEVLDTVSGVLSRHK